MKIAAEMKEEEIVLARTEGNSVLTLVPRRTRSGSANRALRIGISDDLFERSEKSRENTRDRTEKRSVDGGVCEDRGHDEGGESKVSRRIEPLVLLAGLVIGYLLGRNSRN